jgi:glyoxylase I family protein
MTPLGIHHVNITVGDLTAGLAFYVDLLGMSHRTDRPDFPFEGAWLNVGQQQVHLVVGKPPAQTSDHFAIAVADVGATVSELRDAGLEVSAPRGVGNGQQAFIRDPWGNLLELQQPGEATEPSNT